jgi:serine/threonine protein kinase
MLIDFGVSKQVTATLLGQAGTTVGTQGYAPMEQMRGQVYPASDLYSLGVTCIRLLTQCLPKEDGSDELYDALEGRWIWRERLPKNTTINQELGQVLDKLLQDYLKERYQSASEVLQALSVVTSRSSNSSAAIPTTVINFAPVNLISAVGIDYSKLQNLLAAWKWKEADRETRAIMLKISGREQASLLTIEDIESFPCEDLCTIDQLWVRYGHGRFGFSVQKRIWHSIGGNKYADDKTECYFGEQVGWRVKGKLLGWNDSTFSLNAPVGHLPGSLRFQNLLKGSVPIRNPYLLSSIAARLEKCNIQ